jgi:beta-galactosidase
VKKVYAKILFKNKDAAKGVFTVENIYDFTNLDQFNFRWELYRNGEKVNEGPFSVSLAPHSSKDITLNIPMRKDVAGSEYFINLYASTKNATELVPVNHEVAREQFKFAGDWFAKESPSGELKINKQGNTISFTSGNVKGRIDIRSGRIAEYVNGNTKMNVYPEPYFWRAPTDNDFGSYMPVTLGIWRNAHVDRKLKNGTIGDQTAEGVSVKLEYELAGINVPYVIEYFINNDGSIKVTASMDMTGRDLPELPRFGMRMELPSVYNNLAYYGRGPWENYSDRKSASFVGLYRDEVKNQMTWNYIRPQEAGYKTDVRWISLTDKNGKGLQIEGVQPICFSALNVKTEDLDPGLTKKQQHPTDIKPRQEVYLQVDYKQRGVGGDNSWGALPHQEYRLMDKKYSYSYVIKLID